MSNDTSILADNTDLLAQLGKLVSELPTDIFVLDNHLLKSGTIGAHTRHILDHYDAFSLALCDLISDSPAAELDSKQILNKTALVGLSTVNYDQRQRDLRIEQSTEFANNHIQLVKIRLQEQVSKLYSFHNIDSNLALNMICATNENKPAPPLVSSLARELVFLHSHTTHHMAIIRMLALASGHQVESGFGKAASTKQFEQEIKDNDEYVQSQLA